MVRIKEQVISSGIRESAPLGTFGEGLRYFPELFLPKNEEFGTFILQYTFVSGWGQLQEMAILNHFLIFPHEGWKKALQAKSHKLAGGHQYEDGECSGDLSWASYTFINGLPCTFWDWNLFCSVQLHCIFLFVFIFYCGKIYIICHFDHV